MMDGTGGHGCIGVGWGGVGCREDKDGGAPTSCSLSEWNVRGMGWLWVVGRLGQEGGMVSMLCVCVSS